MTATCPHCGGTGLIADPVDARADEFRRTCRERGWPIAADAVAPEAAAMLLSLALQTLANRRSEMLPPRFTKPRGNVRYPIVALAEFDLSRERAVT